MRKAWDKIRKKWDEISVSLSPHLPVANTVEVGILLVGFGSSSAGRVIHTLLPGIACPMILALELKLESSICSITEFFPFKY